MYKKQSSIHDILLAKLEFYGVRGVALQWFKSYLSGRSQFVQYNGYKSSLKGHSTVFRPLRKLHSELFGVGYLEIYAT